MKNNTLTVLRVFARLGKIFSKIIMICCIVGVIGCAIGLVSLSAKDFTAFELGGVTIHSIIEAKSGVSLGTMLCAMTIGLIYCLAEGIIANRAAAYFSHALIDDTPFTLRGAKELLHLGILTAALSIAAVSAAATTYAIFAHYYTDLASMNLSSFSSAGIGVAMIVVSFLLKFGAELGEANTSGLQET